MSIIKDLFGKENGITMSDVEGIIGKYVESSSIECKVANDSYKDIYKKIIKTAIGFLNKPENNSGGLLILGLDARKGLINGIKPVTSDEFRQDKVKNKLLDDIVSIPSSHNTYSLEVIEVPVDGGYLILVEVHKTDPNAVFYSKSENTSYIRRSDTTEKWSLGDMFKFATYKSYAIVYPILNILKKSVSPDNMCHISIEAKLRNDGTSPGRDVIVILKFSEVYGQTKPSIVDVKSFQLIGAGEASYFERLEMDVLQINSKPLYPSLDLIIGSFTMNFDRKSVITIDAFVYENRGITFKKFSLTCEKLTERDFPYRAYLQ